MTNDPPVEARDPDGLLVVLSGEVWQRKILKSHPELAPYATDVLRAIETPDHVVDDPIFKKRRRYYLRDNGPSRWLLVVVSYEQEPARVISAFGNRKDPRLWSK